MTDIKISGRGRAVVHINLYIAGLYQHSSRHFA